MEHVVWSLAPGGLHTKLGQPMHVKCNRPKYLGSIQHQHITTLRVIADFRNQLMVRNAHASQISAKLINFLNPVSSVKPINYITFY